MTGITVWFVVVLELVVFVLAGEVVVGLRLRVFNIELNCDSGS